MWISALELSGLPGLPLTESGVIRQSKRENWIFRKRKGRGGGKEYFIDSLPTETQAAILAKKFASELPVKTSKIQMICNLDVPPVISEAKSAIALPEKPTIPAKNSKQKSSDNPKINIPKGAVTTQKAAAVLAVMQALSEYCRVNKLQKCQSRMAFSNAYNKRQIPVEEWVQQTIPTISIATLSRWEKKDLSELTNTYGHQKGKRKISDPDLVHAIQVHIAKGYSAPMILELIQGNYAVDFDLRTLQRTIAEWKEQNPALAAIVKNPERARGRYGSAIGSQSATINYPNQLWELDSTLADLVLSECFDIPLTPGEETPLLLADGKRYYIIAGIDVYSRRAAVFVSKTSSAEACSSLIHKMALKFGLPEAIKTDNGKDYISNRLKTAIARIVVDGKPCRHIKCKPRNPKQKPHIERFFGTLTRDLILRHPNFIGSNVSERQNIREQQRLTGEKTHLQINFTPEDLQIELDRWCEWYENQREHNSLGMTPLAKWLEGAKIKPPIIATERQLDLMLAPAPKGKQGYGIRKAQKGCLEINGSTYVANELMQWDGRNVHCLYDPLDVARVVVYENEDLQNFICVAQCRELLDNETLMQQAFEANRSYRQLERQGKNLLKEAQEQAKTEFFTVQEQREAGNSKVVHLFSGQTQTAEFQSQSLNEIEEALEQAVQPLTPEPSLERQIIPQPIPQEPEEEIYTQDDFRKFWRQIKRGQLITANQSNWMLTYLDHNLEAIQGWLGKSKDELVSIISQKPEQQAV